MAGMKATTHHTDPEHLAIYERGARRARAQDDYACNPGNASARAAMTISTDWLPTMAHVDDGILGDCWRCCVAGVMGLRRDEVPHFVQDAGDEWAEATAAWVQAHIPGRRLVLRPVRFPITTTPYRLAIGVGRSPRIDGDHAVLVDSQTGMTVWDPHPDRTGLPNGIRNVYAVVRTTESEDR